MNYGTYLNLGPEANLLENFGACHLPVERVEVNARRVARGKQLPEQVNIHKPYCFFRIRIRLFRKFRIFWIRLPTDPT